MLGVGRNLQRGVEVRAHLQTGFELQRRVGIVVENAGRETKDRNFLGRFEFVFPGAGLVAHCQPYAFADSTRVIIAGKALQYLQDVHDGFQFGRKLDLRLRHLAGSAAAKLSLCTLFRVPVSLDCHQPVDGSQIHHQGHVLHPALPLIGDIVGKRVDVKVQATGKAFNAAALLFDVICFVLNVDPERVTDVD